MSEQGTKVQQSTDTDWSIPEMPIAGLRFRECRNIPTERSIVRECFRKDWNFAENEIRHIIAVSSWPRQILGWHRHMIQTDYLFPLLGTFKTALYDDRDDSPTRGQVHVLQLSDMRPGVLMIPPGIWHAFENLTMQNATLLNYIDREFQYEDPDEYRLPLDTPHIPYSF